MGSLKRKVERKKKLENLKTQKKALKKALQNTAGMPTTCSACSSDFDPIEDADTWMIVSDPKAGISLYCPACYNKDKEL